MICGAILFIILISIPLIGIGIAIISLLLGLGGIFLVSIEFLKKRKGTKLKRRKKWPESDRFFDYERNNYYQEYWTISKLFEDLWNAVAVDLHHPSYIVHPLSAIIDPQTIFNLPSSIYNPILIFGTLTRCVFWNYYDCRRILRYFQNFVKVKFMDYRSMPIT